MDTFFPTVLLTYLELFRQQFTSPSFAYFKSYIWAMMIVEGRKTVTNMAHACFFLDKHIASVERFLSDNRWDMSQLEQFLKECGVYRKDSKERFHKAVGKPVSHVSQAVVNAKVRLKNTLVTHLIGHYGGLSLKPR